MKMNPDVNKIKWKSERDDLWRESARYRADHARERPGDSERIYTQIKEIFFGFTVDIDKLVEGVYPSDMVEYSPHLNLRYYSMWELREIDRYKRASMPLRQYSQELMNRMQLRILGDEYGTMHKSDRNKIFNLIVNDSYFSESYRFLGEIIPKPASEFGLLEALIDSLTNVMMGSSSHESPIFQHINLIESLIQKIGVNVFEPQSKVSNDELKCKMQLANLFELYHGMDISRYNPDKFDYEFWESVLLKEYRDLSLEGYLTHPQILKLREFIRRELVERTNIDEIKALFHWSQAPHSSLGTLHRSSFPKRQTGYEPYIDPWTIDGEEYCDDEDGEREMDSLEDDRWCVEDIVNASNQVRKFFHKKKVPGLSSEIHALKDLKQFITSQGFSLKEAECWILELQETKSWEDVIGIVCYKHSVLFSTDDLYSPANTQDCRRALKRSFKCLAKLIENKIKIVSIRTQIKSDALGDRIAVTLESECYIYKFEYEYYSNNILDLLLKDMGLVIKTEKIKWVIIHEENLGRLYLLPKGSSEIFGFDSDLF